jgi:UDP-N-acetylglucosamine 2-epimerase (non-hydrolysing)
MRICSVVGARPNFMKIAPIVHELRRRGMEHVLVHTGQHYDPGMSDVFIRELRLPTPDIHLGVGSGSHATQTAAVMVAFEETCLVTKPDLIVVGGDVNSTLAVALVAAKLLIPLAHVEAGLRSHDRTMPEEINRVVTDHLATLLFVTEESATLNLEREGIAKERTHFVGNCMVDTLLEHVEAAVERAPWTAFHLAPHGYSLLTLHRPANVDDDVTLRSLMDLMGEVSQRLPVVFPVHPRTRERLRQTHVELPETVKLVEPLPYVSFLGLMARARYVLTDSGGIQEETTTLAVPCLTLRKNTERPVTTTSGTNRLVGGDPQAIRAAIEDVLMGRWPHGSRPPLWDGHAAQRIADVLESRGSRPADPR